MLPRLFSLTQRLKLPLTTLALITLMIGLVLWYGLLRELFNGVGPIPLFSNHSDFLAFYGAAKIVLAGQVAHLYDGSYLAHLQYGIVHRKVGAAGYMPYMNPPFAAALLAGLGWFSEPVARIGWFIANTILAVILCNQLAKTLTTHFKQRLLIIGLLMSTFPVYENLVEGQLSIIILGCCYLAFASAQRGKLLVCGGFLSILWLKPQLALMALVILLVFRCWNIAAGLLVGGLGLVIITLPATGLPIYVSYLHYLTSVAGDHLNGAGTVYSSVWKGQLSLTAGINGLFEAIFGQSAILRVDGFTALCDTVLVGSYIAVVKRVSIKPDKALRPVLIAISIGLVMLLDPHLYQQDVVFVYLLLPLLAAKLRRPIMAVVGMALITDLLMLDYLLPLHLFTLALLGFTLGLCWAVAASWTYPQILPVGSKIVSARYPMPPYK